MATQAFLSRANPRRGMHGPEVEAFDELRTALILAEDAIADGRPIDLTKARQHISAAREIVQKLARDALARAVTP